MMDKLTDITDRIFSGALSARTPPEFNIDSNYMNHYHRSAMEFILY